MIEIIKGGNVMKNVMECLINSQVGFQVVDDDTGENKVISYTSYEVKHNYAKYHILYDSIMEPYLSFIGEKNKRVFNYEKF